MITKTVEPAVRPTLDIDQVEEDLDHVVCEIHDLIALCGETFDFPGSVECDDDEDTTCPMCADAWNSGVVCITETGCPGYRTTWQRFVHKVTGGRGA